MRNLSYLNKKEQNLREWRFNSFTLNAKSDSYHNQQKGMNNLEQKWVLQAVKNWVEKGQQNTKVTEEIALITRDNLKN